MIIPFNGRHPRTSAAAFIAPTAVLVGDVHLEASASVWFGAVLRADLNSITVGAGSNIQDNVVIHADGPDFHGTPVVIANDVTIGHGATLHGCTVQAGVLVGMNATIMNGAVIGEHCIIGGGAVVPPQAQIPAGVVVVGAPARVLRPITEDEYVANLRAASSYVALSRGYSAAELAVVHG